MPESPLVTREIAILKTLESASVERAKVEVEVANTFNRRIDEELRAFTAEKNRVTTTARTDSAQIKAKYDAVKAQIAAKTEAETARVENEYAEAKKAATAKARQAANAAKKHKEEARWQALAVFEAGKDSAVGQFKQTSGQIEGDAEHLQGLKDDSLTILSRVRKFAPATPAAVEPPAPAENPLEALEAVIKEAEEALAPLEKLALPKLLAIKVYLWPFLVIGAALTVVLAIVLNLGWPIGAGVGLAVAAALGVALRAPLVKMAKAKVASALPNFDQKLAEADVHVESSRKWAKELFEQRKVEAETKREVDVKKADDRAAQTVLEADQRREKALQDADAAFPPILASILEKRDAALKEADEVFPRKLREVQDRFNRESKAVQDDYDAKKATTEKLHVEAWNALESRWRDALAFAGATADEVNAEAGSQHLDWLNSDFDTWKAPTAVPPGLQFGRFSFDMSDIPQGVPVDSRLKAHGPTSYNLPALTPFPDLGSVLIKTADSGKPEAVKLLQSLMLRFLTSIPPGKVRFTIIDPVGLGENFSAFMHLGDYSELLINGRIWTEQTQIDQRTADLSAHMENVIQKYLRNEFESIEAYNVHAGEVAEPFRVLVAANFPTNWSENAAKRLLSIASTGARCGVYTLISLDTKLPLPSGVSLKDFETHCMNVTWREGKLQWRDGNFGRFPLALDAPPTPAMASAIMHKVGDLAKNANKVEVPFEFIAPTPENYWTQDSRSGVDVPLGRAGATKLQNLKLGKGTSQHVLIAGKTGSGKSTLLHALITNAALRYSPDEIQMYLIDFKKGVEFKVYASLQLPHAKVIAVESEREFGLSVLQRLDEELKNRGNTYRDLGVQDVRGYRDLNTGVPMPRILFIVDEFQEFFSEDDKIAQEVALLLDRLVRQGRAFGIHVHLGSQSLGGANSLPRTTIGQMAVRIALQCSESDAHMILSEENSAARLLTRPGEAIYNDQNGMVEGNNFFQVVFLSDESRNGYLEELRVLSLARGRGPVDQIVFEGNLPAIPSKNWLIAALLEKGEWPPAPKADYAWLGEAIAIKDPTSAVFRPQSGSNVLIVGQNDAMSLGIMAMTAIGLASQHTPRSIRFEVFDGTPADSPLAGSLEPLKDILPHPYCVVPGRDIPKVLGELTAEMERRQKGEAGEDAPNIYLFVHDLQRFRDLRKADDEFGFSSSSRFGEPKVEPPSKLFSAILRDGPPLGIHSIVWCDSLNNLNRTFDRSSLREFEMRILFQMSANDSSTLIDGPAASRIGPNRALYFSEEEGRIEKFRPYSLPETEWLDEVRNRFASRPRIEPPPPPAPRGQARADGDERPYRPDGRPYFGDGLRVGIRRHLVA